MFQGSLPADLQKIVAEAIRTWQPSDLYVAGAGNFTIERVAAAMNPTPRLHSADVSLYTSALGSYYAGKMIQFRLTDWGRRYTPWVEEWMDTEVDALASLMLCTAIYNINHPDSPYFQRMAAANRAQWPRMHAETKTKLLALKLQLTDYTAMDMFDWVRDVVPADAALLSFPPFVAKGYAAAWKQLEQAFSWDPPEYEFVTPQRKTEFLQMTMERPHWLFVLDYREPEFEEHLTSMARTTARGARLYGYSSKLPSRITIPKQTLKPPLVPHLQKGQRLGSRIALSNLTLPEFNALRSRYLNAHIAPGAASIAYGVTVDGTLIGVIAFGTSSSPISMDQHIEGPHVYLMSDFPVGGTSYPQLSRLMVMATLSHEAKALAERAANKRYRSLTTTAFAKNPTSMKYRGILNKLTARQDDDQYVLTYGATLGQWSLAEAFEIWQKKNGKFTA